MCTSFNIYTNAYTNYMLIHLFVHECCMRRHSDLSTQKCMHLYMCTYLRVYAYYTSDAYTCASHTGFTCVHLYMCTYTRVHAYYTSDAYTHDSHKVDWYESHWIRIKYGWQRLGSATHATRVGLQIGFFEWMCSGPPKLPGFFCQNAQYKKMGSFSRETTIV